MASLILRLDTGDAVIDRSTKILREQTGYEVITDTNMTYKLATIGRNENLIINAHGDATSCGNYSVTELASLLARKGLKGPVNIQIIACETGFSGAPYALQLKMELVQAHKIMANVSAPTRYVAVQDNGHTAVMDATFAANGSVTSVTPVNDGVRLVNTPWGTRRVRTAQQYRTT
ncbi:MAG: hypothetical protein IH608_00225 [Proteobacteria bacterium]|nr:hypothetical protein [Pseudomonadota bacterium]